MQITFNTQVKWHAHALFTSHVYDHLHIPAFLKNTLNII